MYYPYSMYFDPTYILIIIGMLFSMAASAKVKSTFNKYARVRAYSGMTGAQVAEQMLHRAGIYDVGIARVSGNLTDHYAPSSKTLRLSDTVYGSTSVAAISVAAHECGHAIQHQKNYLPMSIRGALVPVANFGAGISWPLIILGIVLGGSRLLIMTGIWLFVAVVAFHIVTLPVEFDASSRALRVLEESGILHGDENRYARQVLTAAALTYVASAAAMILQLVRLLLISGVLRNRDDDR